MIFFLAKRYSFSNTARHRSQSIRIMATTALSLSLVVLVISVMNFMQTSRFERIREVRSFDLVVSGDVRDEMKELYPDADVFSYGEAEVLLDGEAFYARYIDDSYNGGIRLLSGDTSVLAVPYTFFLANKNRMHNLSYLKKGRSGATLPFSEKIETSGVYSSSMGQEFDSSMVFISSTDAHDNVQWYTAIKGEDISEKKHLEELGYSVSSWIDSESSLYSAFLVEKTMMYMVLALLFLIISVSSKQCVRIFYDNKKKERAELEILGLGETRINLAFILSFEIVFLISIALSALLSFIFLRIFEKASLKILGLNMVLSFPYAPFACFSLFLILMTLAFCLLQRRKERRIELMEVINAR